MSPWHSLADRFAAIPPSDGVASALRLRSPLPRLYPGGMAPGPGERRDCVRDSECIDAASRYTVRAAHCPPGCPWREDLDRAAERDVIAMRRMSHAV